MFDEKNVNCVDRLDSWEDTIKVAAKPLLELGYIEEKYVDSMLENINKHGFYVVIDEYVAMPHSRPENGVLNTGISFLKVNEAVMYGENEVNLIFVLAAKDADTHIDKLRELLEILQDEDKKEKLLKAKSKKELLNIL